METNTQALGICPGCGSVIGMRFHHCDLVPRTAYEAVKNLLDRAELERDMALDEAHALSCCGEARAECVYKPRTSSLSTEGE